MITRSAVFVMLAVWAAATAFGVWMYPQLPDPAAIHWNIHGQADGFGPRWVNVVLMPALTLPMIGLLIWLPRLGPLRENFQQFYRSYSLIAAALIAAFAALHAIILLKSAGYPLPIGSSLATVFGLLMVVLGNTFGKIRRNFYVGIRTPWTLANELVWDKTHRVGGRLFVAAGLITLVAAQFVSEMTAFIVLMSCLAVSTVWSLVYSYVCYRRTGSLEDLAPGMPKQP